MPKNLSYSFVTSLLEYREGKLFWKVDRGKCKKGEEAGSLSTGWYKRVGICGSAYYTHRLVWLTHFGNWPEGVIDHINGDMFDNRIENLRVVDKVFNTRAYNKSTNGSSSKYRGVSKRKGGGAPWMVRLGSGKSSVYVGVYNCEIEAAMAYDKVAEHSGYAIEALNRYNHKEVKDCYELLHGIQ